MHRKIASLALCAVAPELTGFKPEALAGLLKTAQALVTGDTGKTAEIIDDEIPEEFTGSYVKLKHAGGSDDYAVEVADAASLLKTALRPHVGLAGSLGLVPLVQWIQQ